MRAVASQSEFWVIFLLACACRYPLFFVDTGTRLFRRFGSTFIHLPRHPEDSIVRKFSQVAGFANPVAVADMEEIDLYGMLPAFPMVSAVSDRTRGPLYHQRSFKSGDQEGLPQSLYTPHIPRHAIEHVHMEQLG